MTPFPKASCSQCDVGGGRLVLVSSGHLCVALADTMHGGSGFKVLTTGLLRVELAPEEYQLYSEGCVWGEGEDRKGDQHEDRHQATGTIVSCRGGDMLS